MPVPTHTCPVCGKSVLVGLKTHPQCWPDYCDWRDNKAALMEGRLWPEDGGSWRSVDPEDLA